MTLEERVRDELRGILGSAYSKRRANAVLNILVREISRTYRKERPADNGS